VTAAIDIANLKVTRGDATVLPCLSATIEQGSVVGLMGPSGCGKSTLMRAIVGVQVVDSGRVDVLGEPAGSKTLRDRVGYVTQAASVYTDLTVRENLAYFAKVLGCPPSRVDEVLRQVDLTEFDKRVARNLSGGQLARVSLAAALLNSPEVLVLDEPTVGLDPVLRESLWQLFHSLADAGSTLLVSSHVMDEAVRCDYLLLMREGELIAQSTPAELLETTGSADMEEAFLQLIRSKEQSA
jgi:ABC-2 type transport system ATP-binding protein